MAKKNVKMQGAVKVAGPKEWQRLVWPLNRANAPKGKVVHATVRHFVDEQTREHLLIEHRDTDYVDPQDRITFHAVVWCFMSGVAYYATVAGEADASRAMLATLPEAESVHLVY